MPLAAPGGGVSGLDARFGVAGAAPWTSAAAASWGRPARSLTSRTKLQLPLFARGQGGRAAATAATAGLHLVVVALLITEQLGSGGGHHAPAERPAIWVGLSAIDEGAEAPTAAPEHQLTASEPEAAPEPTPVVQTEVVAAAPQAAPVAAPVAVHGPSGGGVDPYAGAAPAPYVVPPYDPAPGVRSPLSGDTVSADLVRAELRRLGLSEKLIERVVLKLLVASDGLVIDAQLESGRLTAATRAKLLPQIIGKTFKRAGAGEPDWHTLELAEPGAGDLPAQTAGS